MVKKRLSIIGYLGIFSLLATGNASTAPCQRIEQWGRTFMGSAFDHGFQALTFDDRFAGWTSPDTQLYYTIITTNAPTSIWIPKQPEYAYQVELIDTNGIQIPKTELGKKAGSKFLEIPVGTLNTGIQLKELNADKLEAGLATLNLFKIKDLFQIDKPGSYVLRIRFQFLVVVKAGNEKVFRAIRFSPIDCPVRKDSPSK